MLYRNGAIEGTRASKNNILSQGPLVIGKLYDPLHPQAFQGSLDEIRFWDKPLDDDIVAFNYNQPELQKEDGLVLCLTFDDDTDKFNDYSDGGNIVETPPPVMQSNDGGSLSELSNASISISVPAVELQVSNATIFPNNGLSICGFLPDDEITIGATVRFIVHEESKCSLYLGRPLERIAKHGEKLYQLFEKLLGHGSD